MNTLITRLLLAATLAIAGAAGQAATLGLASGAPVLTGTGDVTYVPGTDLSFVGTTEGGIDISAVAALAPAGGLDPDVAPGALLADGAVSGTVTDLGFEIDAGENGGDVIELLLAVEGGTLAPTLGGRALATLTGEFGTDDTFAASEFFSPASIEIGTIPEVAPIPLPAGSLLLASGLALVGLRRRASR